MLQKSDIKLTIYKGSQIYDQACHLSRLRLEAFSEFPYLYIGDEIEDLEYTKQYADHPDGLLITATQNHDVVGVFSGLPLSAVASQFGGWEDILRKNNIDIESTYYAGEMIVKPRFQKRRIFTNILNTFFKEIQSMNYQEIMFVTCYREKDHPLRPANYQPSESNWSKIGAQKTEILLPFTWPTRQQDGSVKMEGNKLICWMRDVADEPSALRAYTSLR